MLSFHFGDASHVKVGSGERSSSDEFGVEISMCMIEPFGYKLSIVYYDSSFAHRIDRVMGLVVEGLLAMPEGALYY